ncbi:PepSY domain-containing protein [Pseudoduganella lutea]|uniref:PepSY domain-containing protein n=1 Tax=Pseudoduganella lutea TaxID=321985 RepID=A0A4P6L0U4_9BURK|nr:PepSY domain-containing protein [Pseudoduganella lutea]QBE65070.1 PepSY domain-containing protein [Pseudoduganella lutea]
MKRAIYLIHRWTGIGMCVLMALWFASGMVMLFVGYPKLTPAERLPPLPALARPGCCIDPGLAIENSRMGAVEALALTSIGGTPYYVLQSATGARTAVDAMTGREHAAVDPAQAVHAASAFAAGAPARYEGSVYEDRWTHARGLNPHRPLHVVELGDAASTRVYVSSTTGQVVLDAPRAERWWNFAGAWLHWLYMLKNQPTDPVWTWTLIALSTVGVFTSVTGIVNGIWRWRFNGRYKSGARTPYRDAAMRWHHMLGLAFGAILCTWVFSGLMSMNPAGIFDAKGVKPEVAAMQGGTPAVLRLPLRVADALVLLAREGFAARELEWRVFDGEPFILARDGANDTRIVRAAGASFTVADTWPEEKLRRAAARVLPYPVASFERLASYDAWYYARDAASMYGADERRLPALRVVFADPSATWVHVDLRTGQLGLCTDRSQRTGRWLFNLLHSWDLPALLAVNWLRIAVLILLSAGGLALTVTATIIACRRLRPARRMQPSAER